MKLLIIAIIYLSYIKFHISQIQVESQAQDYPKSGTRRKAVNPSTSHLTNGPFCREKDYHDDRHYPSDPPEHHLPWIWEGIYDPVKRYVELTTINRIPCRSMPNISLESKHLTLMYTLDSIKGDGKSYSNCYLKIWIRWLMD